MPARGALVSRAQRSTSEAKWCAADPGPPQSVTVPDQRCTAPLRYALHRIRDTQASDTRVPYSLFKQPISFPRRVFCARVLHLCFANPNRGVGGAPRNVRVRAKHPLGLHMTRQARRLRGALRPIARQDARERAYDAGRSPLGAPPWRFFTRGRASLTGICAGSVTASSSHPGRSAWRAGSRASRGERLRNRPPRDATPRSAFRIVSRTRPQ
jgi:hypothetical protein